MLVLTHETRHHLNHIAEGQLAALARLARERREGGKTGDCSERCDEIAAARTDRLLTGA